MSYTNKRIIGMVCVCILIPYTLSSCFFAVDFFSDNEMPNDQDCLLALAKCTVPGASDVDDLSIEIMDTDSYGRILFRVFGFSSLYHDSSNSGNAIDHNNLKAYVISQKIRGGYAFYMENVCYITIKSWDNCTKETLTSFKEMNMWNQAPENTDFSARKANQVLDYSFVDKKELVNILGVPSEGFEFQINEVCVDAQGKTLVFVREMYSPARNEYEYGKSYILISTTEGAYSKEYSIQIDDFYAHKNELIELKKATGWRNPSE